MKTYTFAVGFLLLTTNSFAAHWISASNIQARNAHTYSIKSECEHGGGKCFDVGDDLEIVSQGFASVSNDSVTIDTLGFAEYKSAKAQEESAHVARIQERQNALQALKAGCSDIDSAIDNATTIAGLKTALKGALKACIVNLIKARSE